MVFFRNLFLLFPLAVAQGGKCMASRIHWGPCDDIQTDNTTAIECGDLRVPLDYTRPTSNETLRLQLLRVPAATQPSQGSIQFNFGGPGGTGRQPLADLAPILQALTGGSHDLVAFDPRGTGNTIPFWCFENDAEMFAALNELQLSNASDVMLGRHWARGAINAHMCFERAAETGSLLSTAFVARDLMRVAEALEEDGLLRYWGMSYGTTLGATVAAMFPDRVDKMIMDAVQNPHEYYHALADFEEWTDSDRVFSAIFEGCVAAPENCALAQRNGSGTTAAELEQAVWDALDTLKRRPLALGTFMLDYSGLKGIIAQALYSPSGWPALAATLDLVLAGDVAALTRIIAEFGGGEVLDPEVIRASMRPLLALIGIHCGDRTARAATLDDVMPAVERLYATSRFMGDVTPSLTMTCAQWRIEPRERYGGRFDGVRTRGPVLFIGNTYDAHTPLVSAYNVSSGFEGSVVLEVNGYGHGSLAVPSLCTLETTTAYWLNGSLPDPGTVCESDMPLYSNVTWADVILATAGDDAAASSLARRGAYDVPNLGRIARRGLMY
ncbi:hypothetical protein DL768_005092 [Monosporascus sp. mg162]|nr:hypothetical protein DL768_005092 [Monosporascus sp. mg162]